MHSKTKKRLKGRGGRLTAAAAGIFTALVLLALCSKLIISNNELAERMELVSLANVAIGAVLCGALSSRAAGNTKMMNGVISGAMFVIMLIALLLAVCGDDINLGALCEISLIAMIASALGARLRLYKSDKKLRFNRRKRS